MAVLRARVARARRALRLLGENPEEHARVLRDHAPRGLEDGRPRRVAIPVEVPLEAVRLAPEELVLVHEIRPCLEALQSGQLPGLDRGLALVELLFGRAFLEEARELLVHDLLHAVEVRVGARLHVDAEDRAEELAGVVRGDGRGECVVDDEALVEAAALAVGEDRGDEVRLGVARAEALRRVIRERELRKLDLVEGDAPLHAVQRRGRHVPPRGLFPARERAEELLDEGPDLLRVEIARDDEARVGRRVKRREEVLHVVHLSRLEVLLGPDAGKVVRVRRGIEQLLDEELGAAVGLVLVGLPQLVQDDVALQVELLLVHRSREILEPVRVEPEERREERGGAGGIVVRAVGGRGGVVRSARRFHEPVEVAARHPLGAHEHQVLEQVREAAAAGLLVLAAHAVPDVHGRDGQAVVRVEDHGHPVLQRELLHGEALRGSGDGSEKQEGGNEKSGGGTSGHEDSSGSRGHVDALESTAGTGKGC